MGTPRSGVRSTIWRRFRPIRGEPSSAQQTNSNQGALIVRAHQSRPPSAACGRYQGGPLARTQAGVNNGRQKKIAHSTKAPWAITENYAWKFRPLGATVASASVRSGGVEKSRSFFKLGVAPLGGTQFEKATTLFHRSEKRLPSGC